MSNSNIATEVELFEKFTDVKTILMERMENIPEHQSTNLDSLLDFLATLPIQESEEVKSTLDRFLQNYPYLNMYRDRSLQALLIVDYVLSLNTNANVCENLIKMVTNCWDKAEPLELFKGRIGYFGAIDQIFSTLKLYNNHRETSICVQELLSTVLYTFNEPKVLEKLKQEETFKQQQQITLDMLSERSVITENITNFDVYSQNDENILQHVFSYAMNMNRLIQLKHPVELDSNHMRIEEILGIDLFSLIGDIIFDENSSASLKDIEAIVCNINTNLLHVITKNTCPVISVCDKFPSSPNDELKEILEMLTKGTDNSALIESDISETVRKPFQIKRHDILNYVCHHNELIAYILSEIHGIEPLEPNNDPKMKLNCILLNNAMQMEELSIKMISDTENERMSAALNLDSFKLDVVKKSIKKKEYR